VRAHPWEGVNVEFGVGMPSRAGPEVKRLTPTVEALSLGGAARWAAVIAKIAERVARGKVREFTTGFVDIATGSASRLKLAEQELKRELREVAERIRRGELVGIPDWVASALPAEIIMLPMWRADP
jgi:hypothetical protein